MRQLVCALRTRTRVAHDDDASGWMFAPDRHPARSLYKRDHLPAESCAHTQAQRWEQTTGQQPHSHCHPSPKAGGLITRLSLCTTEMLHCHAQYSLTAWHAEMFCQSMKGCGARYNTSKYQACYHRSWAVSSRWRAVRPCTTHRTWCHSILLLACHTASSWRPVGMHTPANNPDHHHSSF